MVAIKTLRDDFALAFLPILVMNDIARQNAGLPGQDMGQMMVAAYTNADACLAVREKLPDKLQRPVIESVQ